ncbi:glycosyltransferase family 2 protein (plasmid) [Rhizobium sp. WL3]|uniref:glycosyltransferase family 2 protein n=1 Tax=Rhizobium sp. WL3 TaxID=2603277 RepID=UPI0011C1EDA9|nr:glycosyltransferase family 2 protein [Rhizobium sp. WL3]QEE43373.1 glycosyltransferase family 2 protein [Rhizobium sp. WL3]
MLDLTIIILAHNEEMHIERALKAVEGLAKRIVVVDSFSTDRTVEIARFEGAEVLQNKFVNYAKQFEWALENANIETRWVMRLDADEVVEPDLHQEMLVKVPSLPSDVAGINLRRKHIFFDRWIRFGGRYPLILLRIWRHGQGKIEQRWMDEHMVVWGGRTVEFRGGFSDHNLNDLSFFTDKHNKYAVREAIDVLAKKHSLFSLDDSLSASSASMQAAGKRLFKERVYNKLPFWLGPLGYFVYRYTLQLGFLDGRPGLVYHFLQGGWYRFLVGAKVYEYERQMKTCRNKGEMLHKLQQLTGHKLT